MLVLNPYPVSYTHLPETNAPASRWFVIVLSVHAKVSISIAGTICLNPAAIESIHSLNFSTRRKMCIRDRPCALLKTVKHKPPFHIDADKCKNCKSCMRIGCPALVSGDKCITIDNTLCVGCGLCEQLCKFDAIKE